MQKIAVIDNYDSFTFNLVHLLHELTGTAPQVFRNDEFQMDILQNFDSLVLSPGPGIPSEAGLLPEIIKKYSAQKKILGVCLGHQAIGEVFGGKLKNLPKVYHGKKTAVHIVTATHPMFQNISSPFFAGRYHSWTVEKKNLPACLEILAIDEEGEIMAMQHRQFKIWSVQFHPESVMTDAGKQLILNWINS